MKLTIAAIALLVSSASAFNSFNAKKGAQAIANAAAPVRVVLPATVIV